MLDDLARHSADVDALRDRLPDVLDLLSGVTRVIDAESRGHRSTSDLPGLIELRAILNSRSRSIGGSGSRRACG